MKVFVSSICLGHPVIQGDIRERTSIFLFSLLVKLGKQGKNVLSSLSPISFLKNNWVKMGHYSPEDTLTQSRKFLTLFCRQVAFMQLVFSVAWELHLAQASLN